MRPLFILLICVGLGLASCDEAGPPLTVALIAPANDATISGTTAVHATLGDDAAGAEVNVYARGRDTEETGRLIGSVNSSPYILTWNTASLPNGDALELYAEAKAGDRRGQSKPVRTNIQNASAPNLVYVVAYNLPGGLTPQSAPAALKASSFFRLDPELLQTELPTPPLPPRHQAPAVTAQAAANRVLAVEWSWKPVDGANGYRIMLSSTSVAGPYTEVKRQAASAGQVAEEKYSHYPPDAQVGARLYGVVRSLSTNGTESATSNAASGVFLDTQQVASPVNGQAVPDGRPILTWSPLMGVTGYVYFLCDRPCTQADSKTLWTNYGAGLTTSLSAVYPAEKAALASGTYSWWVAGVRRDGSSLSLSYSEQRRLVVP